MEQKLISHIDIEKVSKFTNFDFFMFDLKRQISHAKRTDNKLAVLYIDIKLTDNSQNDCSELLSKKNELSFELIYEIQKTMHSFFRFEDLFLHIKNNTFAATLVDFNYIKGMLTLYNRIHKISSFPIVLANENVYHLKPKIGCSFFPHDHEDANVLYEYAQNASLKDNSNNYDFNVFNDNLLDDLPRRIIIQNTILSANLAQSLIFNLVPIYSLGTENLYGFYSNFHLENEELGFISREDALKVALTNDKTYSIFKCNLQKLCGIYKHLLDKQVSFKFINLNTCKSQLHHPNFISDLKKELETNSIVANKININIEESIFIEEPEFCSQLILEMSQLNLQISIGNVTGTLVASYITDLPIARIFISQDIACELLMDEKTLISYKKILKMGVILDIDIITKGIGSPEHNQYIIEQGGDIGCGEFFAEKYSLMYNIN